MVLTALIGSLDQHQEREREALVSHLRKEYTGVAGKPLIVPVCIKDHSLGNGSILQLVEKAFCVVAPSMYCCILHPHMSSSSQMEAQYALEKAVEDGIPTLSFLKDTASTKEYVQRFVRGIRERLIDVRQDLLVEYHTAADLGSAFDKLYAESFARQFGNLSEKSRVRI